MDLLFLLKVLKEHDGKINGRKRFQKIIFLLKEKFNIPFSYKFLKYYYGPYSYELQSDLSMMVDMGLITEKYDGLTYTYELTEKGKKLLDSLAEKPSSFQGKFSEMNKIEKKVREFKNKETYELVDEAYKVMEEKMGGI